MKFSRKSRFFCIIKRACSQNERGQSRQWLQRGVVGEIFGKNHAHYFLTPRISTALAPLLTQTAQFPPLLTLNIKMYSNHCKGWYMDIQHLNSKFFLKLLMIYSIQQCFSPEMHADLLFYFSFVNVKGPALAVAKYLA